MKYVVLVNNVVQYTFPDFEEFRQKPATELYSKEFLDSCALVEDTVEVNTGDIYDSVENTFTTPEPVIVEEPIIKEPLE